MRRVPRWAREPLGPWMFPNAIAEGAKRTAALKGQHANRIELRDPDDKWPEHARVQQGGRCPSAAGLAPHEPRVYKDADERIVTDPYCRCGALVTERRQARDERAEGAEEEQEVPLFDMRDDGLLGGHEPGL